MSKKSIYVRHQDDIVRKLLEVMENKVKNSWPPKDESTEEISLRLDKICEDEGFIKALKWVMAIDKDREEFLAVVANQRYRKALNEVLRTCSSLDAPTPDKEKIIFEDIFSTCYKALEEDEDEIYVKAENLIN